MAYPQENFQENLLCDLKLNQYRPQKNPLFLMDFFILKEYEMSKSHYSLIILDSCIPFEFFTLSKYSPGV